jgi:ABC-type multidrug transport system ATPase subunit
MKIELEKIGKRFRGGWIVKNVDLVFEPGQHYAITGPNGSGKSTLLKMMCGFLTPSKGKVHFSQDQQKVSLENAYRQLAYAAPYIELIEELNLSEAIDFHCRFRNLQNGLKSGDLIELLGFEKSQDKQVRYFSSGMKQRLKLALAICDSTPLLLLDEPTTNLDAQGSEWYANLLERFLGERTLIVASNVPTDYAICEEVVDILGYK